MLAARSPFLPCSASGRLRTSESLRQFALRRGLNRAHAAGSIAGHTAQLVGVESVRLLVGTSGWQYRLARRGLRRPPAAGMAGPLRARVPHRRGQQRLLPAARALGVRALADETPPGFVVAVKVSRYLTHVKRLRDPCEPVQRLTGRAAGLGDRLGPYLLQLPPTLRADAGLLDDCLRALPGRPGWPSSPATRPGGGPTRGPSWRARRRPVLGRPLGPAGHPLWVTADWGYVRLHEAGVAAAVLRAGGAGEVADRIVDGQHGTDVYVYFNNDPAGPRCATPARSGARRDAVASGRDQRGPPSIAVQPDGPRNSPAPGRGGGRRPSSTPATPRPWCGPPPPIRPGRRAARRPPRHPLGAAAVGRRRALRRGDPGPCHAGGPAARASTPSRWRSTPWRWSGRPPVPRPLRPGRPLDRPAGANLLGRSGSRSWAAWITTSLLRMLGPFGCDVTVVRRRPEADGGRHPGGGRRRPGRGAHRGRRGRPGPGADPRDRRDRRRPPPRPAGAGPRW